MRWGNLPPPLSGNARVSRGAVVATAAGNSTIAVDVAAPRDDVIPGRGDVGGRTSFGGLRGPARTGQVTPASTDTQPAPGIAYAGLQFQHSGRVVRDVAPWLDRGRSTQGTQESHSGIPNPQHDGPARPALRKPQYTEAWQAGQDHTLFEDNSGPFAWTSVTAGNGEPERRRELGTRGDPWTTKLGGTPGLHRPYGARGHVEGPAVGDPADGPQKIRGGVPHGLHSYTMPPYKQTRARQNPAVQPQQKQPRINRPANSRIAGQSWSQHAVPQTAPAGSISPLPRQGASRLPGGAAGKRWRS